VKNIFTLLVCFTITFSQDNIRQADISLSSKIEGKNHSAFVDYFIEGLALSTPFIEFSYAGIRQLEKNKIQPLTIGMFATQLPIAAGKYLFKRERPQRQYKPRLWSTRWTPSFPSGHAASTAAWATIFALNTPNTQPIMIGYVLVTGYSQIYVGNHFISDVIAGWIVGWTTAQFVHTSFESHKIKPTDTPLLRISIPL